MKFMNIKSSIQKNDILESLKRNEFFTLYQPKVYSESGKLASIEALIRWKRNNSIIYPLEFIPMCEENGLVYDIDMYMIRQVITQINELKKNNKKIIPISVNIYKGTLMEENFIDTIDELFGNMNINNYVEFEITERGILTEDIDKIAEVFKNLKERNFRIAVDDYGTGSSNLLFLAKTNVDIIKLDKSIISNIHENTKAQYIIEALITLSKKLDTDLVVEGVENIKEFKFLKDIGCKIIQGYYFSKPVNISDIKLSYDIF